MLVPSSNKKSSTIVSVRDHLAHFKKSLVIIKHNTSLKKILAAFACLGLAYSFLTNLAWIPYLEQTGLSHEYFGYIWSFMAAIGIVAPFLGTYIRKFKSELFTIRLLLFTWILVMLLLLFSHSVLFIAIIFGFTVLFDLARIPLENSYFQNLLPQKEKATIASFSTLLMSSGLIVGYPLVGFIADTFSSLTVLIIGAFLLLPVMWFFR